MVQTRSQTRAQLSQESTTTISTVKGARCTKTGVQRTPTLESDEIISEVVAREQAINDGHQAFPENGLKSDVAKIKTHSIGWSHEDHYGAIGGQCGQSCPCCRAEVFSDGRDPDGWFGACEVCLPQESWRQRWGGAVYPPSELADHTAEPPTSPEKCQGCLEDQPNQLAHIGPNGCLGDWDVC